MERKQLVEQINTEPIKLVAWDWRLIERLSFSGENFSYIFEVIKFTLVPLGSSRLFQSFLTFHIHLWLLLHHTLPRNELRVKLIFLQNVSGIYKGPDPGPNLSRIPRLINGQVIESIFTLSLFRCHTYPKIKLDHRQLVIPIPHGSLVTLLLFWLVELLTSGSGIGFPRIDGI